MTISVEYRPIPAVVISSSHQTFASHLASKAVSPIVQHCRSSDVPVNVYAGMLNRPLLVKGAIKSSPPMALIVYLGHGLADRWVGNELPFLFGFKRGIVTLNDTYLFRNRHVIAIACDTNREMGIRALADGALSYIAWDNNVLVDTLDSDQNHLPDVVDTFVTLVDSMIDTGDPQYAVVAFKYKCDEYIKRYGAMSDESSVERMRNNRNSITVY